MLYKMGFVEEWLSGQRIDWKRMPGKVVYIWTWPEAMDRSSRYSLRAIQLQWSNDTFPYNPSKYQRLEDS